MINASLIALSEVINKLEQIKMVLLAAVANRKHQYFCCRAQSTAYQ